MRNPRDIQRVVVGGYVFLIAISRSFAAAIPKVTIATLSSIANIKFDEESSSDESMTRRIHSTTGGDKTGGLRKPYKYRRSLFPEVSNTFTSAEEESESDDYNIEFRKKSGSDESKTRRIPLRQPTRLRSMRNPSDKLARSAQATRKATKNAARSVISKPTRGHIQNLRTLLAGKNLGVSQKTSKPVSTSGISRQRTNLINAVRYLLQPVLEVTNVGSTQDEVDLHSLAELARTNLLDFQESREKRRHIDLSVISDWVYEKIPDNNQFGYGPNFEGIISLINNGKWVNRQGPDEPSQTRHAISDRRHVAECSLTAFLKLTHASLTGNHSLTLEKVKRRLQEIAVRENTLHSCSDNRYNSPSVIRFWCNESLPYPEET